MFPQRTATTCWLNWNSREVILSWNPLGQNSPSRDAGVSVSSPSAPAPTCLHTLGAAAPPCAPTHPWLSFSPPFKSVWEEVKVTPLPLSQEWVPQLQHVPVHNAVLPKGVIYRKRKRQEAKQSHPTHVLRRWKPRARWLNLLSTRMEPILT